MLKVIDLRPTPDAPSPTIDWTKANIVKENVVTSIKELCYSGIFKHPTGVLANSIRGYVAGNTIYIYSDSKHANAIEEGVRPHTMWYLLNKTIPIRTFFFGQERLIFRRATLKSYLRGAWRHPGTEGKHVFAEGIVQGLQRSDDELVGYDPHVRDSR
jgi:hypothetical protein